MALPNHFQLTLDLPQFHGLRSDNIADWFDRIEDTIRPIADDAANLNARLISILPQKLGGDAYKVYRDFPRPVKDDYDQCRERLSAIFNNQDFVRTFQGSLTARPRRPDENLEVYVAELRNLVSQAFPDYTPPQRAAETLRRLIANVSPFLRGKCHENDVQDLDNAIRVCKNAERAQLEYQSHMPLPAFEPQPVIAQLEPIDSANNDSLLQQLLDEFKNFSIQNTNSDTSQVLQEIRRQGDTLQQIAKDIRRLHYDDRDSRPSSRSRDFHRRRDHYNSPSRNRYTDTSQSFDRGSRARSSSFDRQRRDRDHHSQRRSDTNRDYRSPGRNDTYYRSNRDYRSPGRNDTYYRSPQRQDNDSRPRSSSNDRNPKGILRRSDQSERTSRSPSRSSSSTSFSRSNSFSPHRRVAFNQENDN